MENSVTVSELVSRGTQIQAHEATALVLELIAHLQRADAVAAPATAEPLALEQVMLAPDGTVRTGNVATRPDVSDLARFFETMMAGAGTRVPGALRYTLARALADVDAPAFGSVEEFARALERFEKGTRREIVASLYARGATAVAAPATPETATTATVVHVERRRNTTPVAELRRQLREADRELYELGGTTSAAALVVAAHTPADSPRPAVVAPLNDAPLNDASFDDAQLQDAFLYDVPLHDVPLHDAPLHEAAVPVAAPAEPRRSVRRVVPVVVPAARVRPRRMAVAALALLAVGTSFFAGYAIYAPRQDAPRAVESRVAPQPVAERIADDPTAASPLVEPVPIAEVSEPISGELTRGVSPAFSPSFTPDGSALFFHTGRSADARSALMSEELTADGPTVARILDDGARNYHVQPSPDGRRIAFDSDRDGERGVYVADRDGTNPRRVSGAGYAAVPSWAPDGERLTFVRTEDNPRVWNLWMLSLTTGEIKRLTRFNYGQTWSASWFPDGRRVAFSHDNRLVVLDVDSGRSMDYAAPVPGRLVRTPAVSPDGTHVIFQVSRSGGWLLDLGTGSMRRVLDDRSAEEFAWSPDGRRVAFHSRRAGEWGIWIMAL